MLKFFWLTNAFRSTGSGPGIVLVVGITVMRLERKQIRRTLTTHSMVQGSASCTWESLEIQILRPHPRLTGSESLCNQLPRRFSNTLKSSKRWARVGYSWPLGTCLVCFYFLSLAQSLFRGVDGRNGQSRKLVFKMGSCCTCTDQVNSFHSCLMTFLTHRC